MVVSGRSFNHLFSKPHGGRTKWIFEIFMLINYKDLEMAFEFVSSSGYIESYAYLSLETGKFYFESETLEEVLPFILLIWRMKGSTSAYHPNATLVLESPWRWILRQSIYLMSMNLFQPTFVSQEPARSLKRC